MVVVRAVHIDRILVCNQWMSAWPTVVIRGLKRTVSDHCPILMETKQVDWGPKSFRFINAGCAYPEFKKIIEDSWNSYEVDGWSGFKMKEKLKRLKEDLRNWNIEVLGVIESKVEKFKQEINELDIIDDAFGLEEEEIIKRKCLLRIYSRASINGTTCMRKKAKIKWLKEGDINSSFFHGAINFRRKKNETTGLTLNGCWTEEVGAIKYGVKEHFLKQYNSNSNCRLFLAPDIFTRSVSAPDNIMLTEQLSEEEVLQAIKNYDTSKSLGPNGFYFKFIKECWSVIKDDILKMLEKFHENGKLVYGLNTSFIVLIPKKEATDLLKVWNKMVPLKAANNLETHME